MKAWILEIEGHHFAFERLEDAMKALGEVNQWKPLHNNYGGSTFREQEEPAKISLEVGQVKTLEDLKAEAEARAAKAAEPVEARLIEAEEDKPL